MNIEVQESVRDYYANVLKTSDDLKTNACCLLEAPPAHIQTLLENVHETVREKFYGCGSPLPPAAEGRTVLDLGCGAGRDAYILSQMVGADGQVIGVDFTEEQLSVANMYLAWHMDKFGFGKPNLKFVRGEIENLKPAGITDASIDVVISNCVINLSTDKEAVFKEIFRVLKPGGEFYFSDIFAGRRIPENLQNDSVLRGECLGGAMYIEDFRRLLRDVGILDFRTVSKGPLSLEDPEVRKKAGMIDFYSITLRAFKVDLEDTYENYGHVAYYKGTISESPDSFILDDHHEFKKGLPVPVCGNTANMLARTRLAKHFSVEGDFSTHHGPFDCTLASSPLTGSGACC